MQIKIHKPELQFLIRQAMADGRFREVEEAMLQAFKTTAQPAPAPTEDAPVRTGSELVAAMQAIPYKDVDFEPERERTLEEVFAKVRGLADDLDFSRDPSSGRPVDFS